MDMYQWHERLAGDRRIVGVGEEDRDGRRWVVAHCRDDWSAYMLLRELREQGHAAVERLTQETLWLEPAG